MACTYINTGKNWDIQQKDMLYFLPNCSRSSSSLKWLLSAAYNMKIVTQITLINTKILIVKDHKELVFTFLAPFCLFPRVLFNSVLIAALSSRPYKEGRTACRVSDFSLSTLSRFLSKYLVIPPVRLVPLKDTFPSWSENSASLSPVLSKVLSGRLSIKLGTRCRKPLVRVGDGVALIPDLSAVSSLLVAVSLRLPLKLLKSLEVLERLGPASSSSLENPISFRDGLLLLFTGNDLRRPGEVPRFAEDFPSLDLPTPCSFRKRFSFRIRNGLVVLVIGPTSSPNAFSWLRKSASEMMSVAAIFKRFWNRPGYLSANKKFEQPLIRLFFTTPHKSPVAMLV